MKDYLKPEGTKRVQKGMKKKEKGGHSSWRS